MRLTQRWFRPRAPGVNKVENAGITARQLIAYTSVEQEHAWENLGITISQVIKEGGSNRSNDLDLLFSGKKP